MHNLHPYVFLHLRCKFAIGVYFRLHKFALKGLKVVQFFCTQGALALGVFWPHEHNFLSNGLILKDIAFFFFKNLSIKIE